MVLSWPVKGIGLLDDQTAFTLVIASTAVLFLIWIVLRIKTRTRRPRLHPRLQKYGGADDEHAHRRRKEAERIIATSSTSSIAGYKIVRQVEAVFVDGFRRPEEAIEGLKAVAAMKEANALINLQHERSAAGKCSASGDAIVVEKIEA